MDLQASADARVLLIERVGCHLCADAHRVLDAVTAATGQRWVSVDVDASEALQMEFGELVPVVLVDGVARGHWRLETAPILAALRD
jgi:hypothetical protein